MTTAAIPIAAAPAAPLSPLPPQLDPRRLVLALAFVLFISGVVAYWVADIYFGLALLVLWVGWQFLPRIDGSHALFFPYVYEWVQVTIGQIYPDLTGRQLALTSRFDPHRMLLVGFGCLLAMTFGLRWGFQFYNRHAKSSLAIFSPSLPWRTLRNAYLGLLLALPVFSLLARMLPPLGQALGALAMLHYIAFFLLLRRLLRPQPHWGLAALLVGLEFMLSLGAAIAAFQVPLIFAGIVFLDLFDRRRLSHWLVFGILAVTTLSLGVLWTGIKFQYRDILAERPLTGSQKLQTLASLAEEFKGSNALASLDKTVNRLWQIYYPAVAMERVPAVIPYQHGAVLWKAISFALVPRWIDPNKGVLPSDSDEVTRYTGIQVAGARQGTSVAFGYAGESYVDFGIPGMFVPILLYAALWGALGGWFCRHVQYQELALAAYAVMACPALLTFEISWVKRIGMSGNVVIFLGGAVYLINRYLVRRNEAHVRAWIAWRSGRPPQVRPVIAEVVPRGATCAGRR